MIKITNKIILSGIFFSVVFCGLITGAQEEKERIATKVYRSRQLGDKAFKDGLYELAAKFYSNYQKEAEGDTEAQIDASECQITAYVRSGNSVAANRVFDKLTTTFAATISKNAALRNRLSYWDGNIQMSSGHLKKASEIFTSLLNTLPQNTELYFQTLDALGTTQAYGLQWEKAEKTYALLEYAGKKTKWKALATRKRLLALLMAGNYNRVHSIIKTIPKGKMLYTKIIENLILIKKNKLKEATDAYKKIRKYARASDPLWYMFTSSLANAYLAKKEYNNALMILNDSVLFANSEFDRQQALLSIINTAVATGNSEAAVSTAEKFLKNYPESFLSNEIRVRLATLYAGKQKPEDALQVYETVIKDPDAESSLKIKSARSAAHLFISMKRYPEAKEKFLYMSKEAKDKKTQGEGEYWIAELLYIQGKYKEAAEAFGDVATKFAGSWKDRALFKQIKSLMNTDAHSESVNKIKVFLEENPESKLVPDASFLYAIALKKDKKIEDAEKQFAKFAEDYPDHIYAPRALFEEGTLALNREKTDKAITAYTKLIERYPDNALIPNTLYRRMFVYFWNTDDKEAISDVQILFTKYPKSSYTIHAGFRLADYYTDTKKYNKAIDTLNKMIEMYNYDSKIAARALYETANVRFKEEKDKEVLKILNELSEKFPEEDITNDGLFLRGDIYSKESEYEKAIPYYEKAAANRPNSLLETASWGRIGDAYLALGWKTPDGTNYQNASKFYNKVLSKKKISARYRDQALYKLGRCEELQGNKEKALSKFHEVIYNYELDLNADKMIAKSSIWFVKSALAAIRLHLAKETPESAEAAIVLYKTLIKLGIEPIDDFKKRIKEISNKYKLTE